MGASARRFDVDQAGIGVLAEAFPLETVREILRATGREGKRKRLLPAMTMVYYVIALGLFVGVGCREVLRRLLDGATWIWPGQVLVATESAITQARQRLGCKPIEELYNELVRPIAKKITRGAWFRLWRVVSLDGFTLDVAESDENLAAFGRPGASRGKSAYPQVRVVGFVENGTHVFFGAEMDRYEVGEITIARRILGKLRRNMLCLADRNFFCYPLWQQAVATGAKLVWRAKLQMVLPKVRKLADGSYLAKSLPLADPPPSGSGRHPDSTDRLSDRWLSWHLPLGDEYPRSGAGAGAGVGPPLLGTVDHRDRIRRDQNSPPRQKRRAPKQAAGTGSTGCVRSSSGALRRSIRDARCGTL